MKEKESLIFWGIYEDFCWIFKVFWWFLRPNYIYVCILLIWYQSFLIASKATTTYELPWRSDMTSNLESEYGPNFIWFHVCLDSLGLFWPFFELWKKDNLPLLELSAPPQLKLKPLTYSMAGKVIDGSRELLPKWVSNIHISCIWCIASEAAINSCEWDRGQRWVWVFETERALHWSLQVDRQHKMEWVMG